jgi:mono/diheme cytochrome c family protein
MRKRSCAAVLSLFAILVSCAADAAHAAQGNVTGRAVEIAPLSPVAEAGRSFYLESCAPCHGRHATGDGPVAASLAVPPPDLTRIAERRDGEFPIEQLASIINGDGMVSAHGSREMPVWGKRFAEEERGDTLTDRLVMGRIRMLLYYLQAVQR